MNTTYFKTAFRVLMGIFIAISLYAVVMKDASAHHVGRVIVEHHYPYGVTRHSGRHGSRHYHHGGHYGPNTCYRECFHQPRYGHGYGHYKHRKYGHYKHRKYGHHRGSSVQFGFSVGGHGHHGFRFGFSQRR